MFIEEVIKTYGKTTPVFAEEILDLFSCYSRAYVFRLIKDAERCGELVFYSRGVYFVPQETFFGQSTICADMVAEKKYIRKDNSVFGVYAGLNLLNRFGVTTQVPNTVEIVTNNETTRKRRVEIGGRDFIVRKARCEITSENQHAYTVLQLFSDMNKEDILDSYSKTEIVAYINENKISREQLYAMALCFPSSSAKKMIGSGVLDGIT